MSDTPRTDAEVEDARNVALDFDMRTPRPKEGENIYVVSADFARKLERELNRCIRNWEKAADQPDVQEAVIQKLNLVHADVVRDMLREIKELGE